MADFLVGADGQQKSKSATASRLNAPIAIFAYRRPKHLQLCLESLRANAESVESDLFVFCDGPRSPKDERAVKQVRAVAEAVTGFATVKTVLRSSNVGLANSIIEGVGEILAHRGKVIVVEDDLVVSPFFLRYMNDALHVYAEEDRVASIHGYCYPVTDRLPDTFFLRGADCWGWGTWARAWRHFTQDGQSLLDELRARRLTDEFDLDGAYPFTRMLEDQVAGRNNSWAVRWHASCFLRNRLTLYPGTSLVNNIGNDASGTHAANTRKYDVAMNSTYNPLIRIAVAPDPAAREAFVRFLRPSLKKQVLRFAARLKARCEELVR